MNYSKYTLKNSSKELNSVTKKQPKLKLNFISTSLLLTSIQNPPPFRSLSVVRKRNTQLLAIETERQLLWQNRETFVKSLGKVIYPSIAWNSLILIFEAVKMQLRNSSWYLTTDFTENTIFLVIEKESFKFSATVSSSQELKKPLIAGTR